MCGHMKQVNTLKVDRQIDRQTYNGEVICLCQPVNAGDRKTVAFYIQHVFR